MDHGTWTIRLFFQQSTRKEKKKNCETDTL